MERARQKGIVFNKDNLQLKPEEVHFFGHTWTPQGVKPDNRKVAAIQSMQPPGDVKSLQSFQGLVNYLTRYSAHLATILRHLSASSQRRKWPMCGAQSTTVHSLQSNRKYQPSVC